MKTRILLYYIQCKSFSPETVKNHTFIFLFRDSFLDFRFVSNCVVGGPLVVSEFVFPSRHLLIQSKNGNTRTIPEKCSKLTKKTPERLN